MIDKPWGISCLAAFLLLSSACSSASENDVEYIESSDTLRVIEQGELSGVLNTRNKARAWFGIPFAEPPVGDLRWRAPRPAQPFDDVFVADTVDRACVQLNEPAILPGKAGAVVGSEDCLYLNIWAPSQESETPYPVMVWVHGGGNVSGFAGQLDFSRLAARENVVVVALNYRLGPMGWFSNDSLRATAQSELDQSANFGLLDLIEGLKWVRSNISAFGGDESRLTIFGESAGGFNISSLMTSPLSEGLFDAAIIQSAGFNSFTLKEAEIGPETEEKRRGASSGEAIAALTKQGALPSADDKSSDAMAAALRKLPAETLYDVYRTLTDSDAVADQISNIDNTADGIVLPIPDDSAGSDRALIASRDIPLIIGTNRDEARVASMENPVFTNKRLGVLFRPKNRDTYIAAGEYPSRLWASLGVQRVADIREDAGVAPTFTYRLDWDEQGKFMFSDFSLLIGALHSIDLNFISGDFRLSFLDDKAFFKPETEETRRTLSHQMMSYWASFARSGSPNASSDSSLPQWPAWSQGGQTLVMDTETDGGLRAMPLKESVDELIQDFVADERFSTDEERCETAGVMTMIALSQNYPTAHFEDLSARFCKS